MPASLPDDVLALTVDGPRGGPATLTGRLAGPVPLSVLDLSHVGAGQTSSDALAGTTRAAVAADALGYGRYWVAEHHNAAAVASTTPPVLIAHLAARTERIAVGSGGVMLPNHPALVVAEQFALLEALHPGRIDLGIGRAPGTDPRTAAALRRTPEGLGAEDFPAELTALLGLLGDERLADTLAGFAATPAPTSHPQVWLLGSSGYSAQVAGALGLPFAHAAHFGMGGEAAVDLYRRSFVPSPHLDVPHALVTASVMVAETAEEARYQAAPLQHAFRQLRTTGALDPLLTPADAARLGPPPASAAALPPGVQHVGTPEEVVAGLRALAARTGADELMVTTAAHDPAVRVRSLELLAHAARAGSRPLASSGSPG